MDDQPSIGIGRIDPREARAAGRDVLAARRRARGLAVAVVPAGAIVLPVAAQLCAAGIQVYALFHEIGRSERLVTLIVLIVATVQIVISRPRAPSEDSASPGG
jgi:hypothetical protein